MSFPHEAPDAHPIPPSLRLFRELALETMIRVQGGSMEPAIPAGESVRLRGDSAPPRVGDVVAFWDGIRVVVHRVQRVIEEEGRICFETRGDANPKPDTWVGAEQMVGRIVAFPPPGSLVTRLRLFCKRALRALGACRRDCGFPLGSLGVPNQPEPTAAKLPLALQSVLRRRLDLSVRSANDDLLVRSSLGTAVHVLNSTAREIWERLNGSVSLEEIAAELGRRYQRDLRDDVLQLASALREMGLVEDARP